MANWNNENKNMATWTNNSKVSESTWTNETISTSGGSTIGSPIGLALILTYATVIGTTPIAWTNEIKS